MTAEAYEDWRAHGGVFDLSSRTKLRLTGADRVRYLNGQVTANIKTLAPAHAIPACVTTAKGRLCAEVFISATADALWIDADDELRESLPVRLDRYIVADDVILEDVTDAYALLHFAGPEEAGRAFAAQFPSGIIRRSSRLGSLGWDILLEKSSSSSSSPSSLPLALAELIRIEAGIPRWGRELTEETLPPEAGLDHTHIDYAKGCYIGQEVISRIKSVGHVNRRLCGFISMTGVPLEPGWALFAGPLEGAAPSALATDPATPPPASPPPPADSAAPATTARPLGELTSAAYSFALAKPIALGYLRRGSPTGALLAGPARVPVTPAELPLVRHFSSP